MNSNPQSNAISNDKINLLPWDLFKNWLYCICVVTFDLEIGQAMEVQYPNHMKLTEKEKSNICYLSFPDSNSGCMGDTSFHFRIRKCNRNRQNKTIEIYNKCCPIALQSDAGYYYGFVYFRQTKDKTIRRGYFQKSLVIITHLPFINLFTNIVSTIAPQYFQYGQPSLEAACHDIDQWPPIVAGESLNLPMLGQVLQIRVPSKTDKLFNTIPEVDEVISSDRFLSSVNEIDLYTNFQHILPHMQMIWELVLTGEPMVVMSSIPKICSSAVQAFISMIWPLKYAKDYRPYFTIHDSEFSEYTTKTQAPPHVILGVTNPFFSKMLQHWPSIIRIGEFNGGLILNEKSKKTTNIKVLHSKPGVYTKYKPFLTKDKNILKQVAKGVLQKRPTDIQTVMIRRYLYELTQNFMIPLERYVASLMPLQKDISPHKSPPLIAKFQTESFLSRLDSLHGPQQTSGIKGDWKGLYRKFIDTDNFAIWYREKETEVNAQLNILHIDVLSRCNLLEWSRNKAEVQIVDLILRIREKIKMENQGEIKLSSDVLERLKCHLSAITVTLPSDLQDIIMK